MLVDYYIEQRTSVCPQAKGPYMAMQILHWTTQEVSFVQTNPLQGHPEYEY